MVLCKASIKQLTAKRYSDEQVHLWRRSYDIQPPALTKEDERAIPFMTPDTKICLKQICLAPSPSKTPSHASCRIGTKLLNLL